MCIRDRDYHYCRDHLGSVREVLASDGTLVARYDYTPYGERIIRYEASGYTACDLGFTGHITLPSLVLGQTELVLTHYRAHNPELGRWLSVDPIGEEGGVNLYGYVVGCPIDNVDPDGLELSIPPGAKGDYNAAKKYISRTSEGKRLFDKIENSRKKFCLTTNCSHDDHYDPRNREIAWDAKSALKTTTGGTQSPALGLAHEIDHATANGFFRWLRVLIPAGSYDNQEEKRVICGSERVIANGLGEDTRTNHRGNVYHVRTPITR